MILVLFYNLKDSMVLWNGRGKAGPWLKSPLPSPAMLGSVPCSTFRVAKLRKQLRKGSLPGTDWPCRWCTDSSCYPKSIWPGHSCCLAVWRTELFWVTQAMFLHYFTIRLHIACWNLGSVTVRQNAVFFTWAFREMLLLCFCCSWGGLGSGLV